MENIIIIQNFDLGHAINWWDKFNTELYIRIIKAKQSSKQYTDMDDKKLKLYFEDIDNIFEITKEELGYNDFALSCKKIFDPTIDICLQKSKESIKKYIYCTETAVDFLSHIQNEFKKMLTEFRVNDELYKSKIYTMGSNLQTDSMLPYNFNLEDWKFSIKIEDN